MKASNRFLLGFGIAIGALIIVTLVLVATIGQRNAPLLPENTPEGVVQRFLVAIQERDYPQAYSYLGPDRVGVKVTYEDWVRQFQYNRGEAGWKATLGQTVGTGDERTVEVIIEVFRPGGPFEDPVHTNRVNYFLKRTGDTWRIIMPADVWWIY